MKRVNLLSASQKNTKKIVQLAIFPMLFLT